MKYFTLLTDTHYVSKNKLEKELKEKVKDLDRVLLSDDVAKDSFMQTVKGLAEHLNVKHTRCNALTGSINYDHGAKLISISVYGVFRLTIYEVRAEL